MKSTAAGYDTIKVIGAREHNLKDISLEIPKNRMVVFTGVSGSGKSSLVFDTICAEAQRQLIETFSAYARRRLPKISRPDVDEIKDLSPVMVIDQKRLGRTLRSTVGTATEIYNYLRLLYSRFGEPSIGSSNMFSFNNPEGMCPRCKGLGKEMVIDENKIVDWELSVADGAIIHSDFRKGGWFWKQLTKCGFFDPHKPVKDFSENELHNLLYMRPTKFSNTHLGEEYQSTYEGVITKLKRRYINKEDGADAYTRFFSYRECSQCNGTRISERASSVVVNEKTIPDLVFLEMPELLKFVKTIHDETAKSIIRKMKQSIQYLIDIGVGYLSLHRPVATLSGGESQRVKMAKQLDCNLVNLVYILDEPSIGLHPRDISKLIEMLRELRDKGNTILVVEHDPSIITAADHVVDIGPMAGSGGGRILFQGSVGDLMDSNTVTARFLESHQEGIRERRNPTGYRCVNDATLHNLKNITVKIPAGIFVCVTGVAGSGKSTLINEVFTAEHPDAIVVDQSPVGRSSRSNPLTYLGVFTAVRNEFAKVTSTTPDLFSFNSKGACSKCKGLGVIKVEMSFLDDVAMTCDKCQGKRYTEKVLELQYKDKTIYDILQMTASEAIEFFEGREIRRKLGILEQVGLDYLELGQPLSTLSGGEAQRMKLARELHKKGNIYVMDEPTTGLHMADTKRLLGIIDSLVESGNTVIVIEHNLDVVKNADWVIDLGPEGGSKGGWVMAEGTPEDIMEVKGSYTGQYLKGVLGERS